MSHSEIIIKDKKNLIHADLKIPKKGNGIGLILLHGGIMNRKSLSRDKNSLAEYCCNKLNAHVITPDIFGDTIVNNHEFSSINDSIDLINTSTNYLYENYNLVRVLPQEHSRREHRHLAL